MSIVMREIDRVKKRPDFETEGQRGHYANRCRLVGSDVMEMNREVEKENGPDFQTEGHYAK